MVEKCIDNLVCTLRTIPLIQAKFNPFAISILSDAIATVFQSKLKAISFSQAEVECLVELTLQVIENSIKRSVINDTDIPLVAKKKTITQDFKKIVISVISPLFDHRYDWFSVLSNVSFDDGLADTPSALATLLETPRPKIKKENKLANFLFDVVLNLQNASAVVHKYGADISHARLLDIFYRAAQVPNDINIYSLAKISYLSTLFRQHSNSQSAVMALEQFEQAAGNAYIKNRMTKKIATYDGLYHLQKLITHAFLSDYYSQPTNELILDAEHKERYISNKLAAIKHALLYGGRYDSWLLGNQLTEIMRIASSVKSNLLLHDQSFITLAVVAPLEENSKENFVAEEYRAEIELLKIQKRKYQYPVFYNSQERRQVYEIIGSLRTTAESLKSEPEKKMKAAALIKLADKLHQEADQHYQIPLFSPRKDREAATLHLASITFRDKLISEVDRTFQDPDVVFHRDDDQKIWTGIKNALLIIFFPALLLKKAVTSTWFCEATTRTQERVMDAKQELQAAFTI